MTTLPSTSWFVEHLDDLGHAHDRRNGERWYLLLDLLLGGGDATLANLHAVEAHDDDRGFYVGRGGDLGVGLVDGLARGGDVLDHHDAVAVVQLGASRIALVGTVVLGLLAVGAVADILP